MPYSSSLSLPDCASITATTPCAPCFFGGRTSYLTFPYTLTSTVTVTVYPVYTGYEGSSTFLSYETDSITVTLSENGQPIPTFGADLTWEVNGLTLTSGTTYASFANFSGAAPAQTPAPYDRRDAVTRTRTTRPLPYQIYPSKVPLAVSRPNNSSKNTCIGLTDTTSIKLPATIDPSSFIIPVTTSTNSQFTPGVLPAQIIQYLGGLSTVTEQLSGNRLETCSPTTYPQGRPTVCTYVTTISSQTSAITSCRTTTSDGTSTSICTTSAQDGTPIGTTMTSAVTAIPSAVPYPSAPGSAATSAVSKTSGLSILTETGTNRLKLPTAGAEHPPQGTQRESQNESPTNTPYPGPTAQVQGTQRESQNESPMNTPYPEPTAQVHSPNQRPPSNQEPPPNQQPPSEQNTPGANSPPSNTNPGQDSQPDEALPSDDQPSDNTGEPGDQLVNGANIPYGTSPADENPGGSSDTYIPPPIISQDSPTPIIYTTSGTAVTYYPAPAVTTISGAAITYYPIPWVSTVNGAPVTYYPPAAGPDASTSPRPPPYVPVTIPPTEQGCTATVTVTYSPVMAGNLTETTSAGMGDYVNTGTNSGAPAQQTGAAGGRAEWRWRWSILLEGCIAFLAAVW